MSCHFDTYEKYHDILIFWSKKIINLDWYNLDDKFIYPIYHDIVNH